MECISSATSFIKGENSNAISELTARMEESAERLDFELAARLRDRINAIKRINEKQKVIVSKYPRQDVIAVVREGDKYCFCVLNFDGGHLCDCSQYVLDVNAEENVARYEFIQRYYNSERAIPPRVLCDGDVEDAPLLSEWLTGLRGKKVEIFTPQIGDQYKLVEMCRNNAAEYLSQQANRTGIQTQSLKELGELLGLAEPPQYIEAYDISNTAGHENVAGMTVFFEGKPLRSAYKRFKIKSFEGQDDYGSMREVLERRFLEYEKHKESGEGFGRMPDLILLDGGQGQLSAARQVTDKMGINVPMFGMVKDSKHRTRAIAADGGDITIKANRRAYTLVATIQEETHRFAIGYHRQRSKKTALASRLTEIPGVGKTRAEVLLKHFKTLSNISDATVEELESVKGMTHPTALSIYNYFHGE